jgi:hypothetical protein
MGSLWSNFFVAYIGRAGHMEAGGEVSGATVFVLAYVLDRPCGGSRGSLWKKIVHCVYRLDRPYGGRREVSGAHFFVAYIC